MKALDLWERPDAARASSDGMRFPVCFCDRARPERRERLQEPGIPLVFSYDRISGPGAPTGPLVLLGLSGR